MAVSYRENAARETELLNLIPSALKLLVKERRLNILPALGCWETDTSVQCSIPSCGASLMLCIVLVGASMH